MNTIPNQEQLAIAYRAIKGVKLPAIPKVVQETNTELISPNPDINQISRLISTDTVLSGMVLKIVNSPSYALTRKVESIQQSVALLGVKNLKSTVISAALKRSMGKNEATEEFWAQSSLVAACAASIARMVQGIEPDIAYMTGLFMDSGALMLLQKYPTYKKVIDMQAQYHASVIDIEIQKIKTHHAVISYMLAVNWQLPDEVTVAILNHHTNDLAQFEETKIRPLIAIIQLAYSLVANELAHEQIETEEYQQMQNAACQELMLQTDDLSEIIEEAMET